MSLVPCRECRRPVSTGAVECPGCGERDPSGANERKDRMLRLVALAIALIGIFVLFTEFLPQLRGGIFFR